MCSHELLNCPRCQQEFECKCGSIELCQCTRIDLSEEQRDAIASQYQGCLCAECLQQFAEVQPSIPLKYIES